jgi:virginiamycin A acetyltransferase
MRTVAKRIADAVALILVLPAVGMYRLSTAVGAPNSVFPGYSQGFSLIPGVIGIYLRRAFYRYVLPRCGQDVCISFGTVFSHPTVSLGNRVYIGVGCMIGDATLEDDVLIGSHVSIINGRRQHGIERLDVPVREQPGEYPPVVIGRDSWIGDRSLVTVSVGGQSVIGCASVVIAAVPSRSIVVGNPGRAIGSRDASQSGCDADIDSRFHAEITTLASIVSDQATSRVTQ